MLYIINRGVLMKIIDIIDPIFSELEDKDGIEFRLDLRFFREWEE